LALGAGSHVPAEIQKLNTYIGSAYSAVQQAPCAAVLANRKLTQAFLTAYIVQLDELFDLDGNAKGGDRGATVGTQARDAARAALSTWSVSFRKQAKTDLLK